MASTSTTPITTKVAEVPLTTPLLDKNGMSSIWNKWLSQVGTYLTKSQENKSGDLSIGGNKVGTYRATRVGNIVQVVGEIPYGDYSGIIVTGIPVLPIMDVPVLVVGGSGVLSTSGELKITCSSTSKILISAGYIAAAPKESN